MKIQARHKLIPAIAMLLIAVVCLSSASYAWFTMSRTVTATGMQLTVIAPTNLLISNAENGTYAETTAVTENFGTAKLFPSSTVDGLDFYVANQIKAANNGAPDATTTFTKSNTPVVKDTTDGAYADFKVWLKTTGEDTVNVTVSQALTILSQFATYAVDASITDNDSLAAAKLRGTGTTIYKWTANTAGEAVLNGAKGDVAEATETAYAGTNTYVVKIADAVANGALRFAILNAAGDAIITTNSKVIYSTNAGKSLEDYFNTNPAIVGPISATNAANAATQYIGTPTDINDANTLFTCAGGPNGENNTPTGITIRVWVEGQDADCVATLANSTFDLTVGFKDASFTG